MIRLIALLGNPGKEYEKTRHNAPWLTAEFFSFAPAAPWQEKFKGEYTAARTTSDRLYLVKPLTYMNLSGECVQKFLGFFKIPPPEFLAVHDEIELPFGVVSFRFGGGLGGHNGLKSLVKNLGTPDFYRFRIGVGRPKHGDASSHVLGRFSKEEEPLLGEYLKRAAAVLEDCLAGPERAAEHYKKVTIL